MIYFQYCCFSELDSSFNILKQNHCFSRSSSAPNFRWEYLFCWVRWKGLIPIPGHLKSTACNLISNWSQEVLLIIDNKKTWNKVIALWWCHFMFHIFTWSWEQWSCFSILNDALSPKIQLYWTKFSFCLKFSFSQLN